MDSQIYIRTYREEDCPDILGLFYQTVHHVNIKDYTKEQVDVWADGKADEMQWNKQFLKHETFVALRGEQLIGFGDIDKSGYLDKLYVHKDFQRRGIATVICDKLEACCTTKIIVHASITAKPFFMRRGYRVIRSQQVERHGVELTNYIMEK